MTAIGIAVRTRLLICCVLVAALALVTAACGGSGSKTGSSDTGTATSSNETATNPPTEGTGTETAGKGQSGVTVEVASLPIGGGTDGVNARQCVTVNWTGDQIPEGATVRVTSVGFTASNVFTVAGGGCNSDPGCVGFTFTSSPSPCSVLVQATAAQGKTTVLKLTGSPHCGAAQKDWCANLKAGDSTIELTQPGSETETTTTTSTTTTPTTTTPTTTTTTTTPTTTTTTTTSPPSPNG